MQLEVCANCEEVIDHTPVYTGGQSFCCTGCGVGGPCACTYHAVEQEGELQAPSAASPIRFPRPGDQTIVTQITGFLDQRDIIKLAGYLEASPVLAEVTLACLADSDAWLTMRASSPDAVLAVLSRSVRHELDIVVNQNFIEARILTETPYTSPQASCALDAALGVGGSAVDQEIPKQGIPAMTVPGFEDGSVLPPRPRFRVFRSAPTAPAESETARDISEDVRSATGRPTPPVEDSAEGEFPESAQYCILATQPFRSFSTVNAYHQVIRELEGVQSTHVKRFERGILYLAVTYQSRVPLRQRLERIEGYTLEVLNETNSRIEVALRGAPVVTRARNI